MMMHVMMRWTMEGSSSTTSGDAGGRGGGPLFRWGKGGGSPSCGREVYLLVSQRRFSHRSASSAAQGAKQGRHAEQSDGERGEAGWAPLGPGRAGAE